MGDSRKGELPLLGCQRAMCASCTHEWVPHSVHAAPQVAARMAHAALSAAANQLCSGRHSMALAALSIVRSSALPCRLHHACTMQAQVAELKDVKGDAVKFEACAKAAHELLAEGEKLKVKMEAEMEALKVGVLVDCGQLWAVFGVSRLEVWVMECMGKPLKVGVGSRGRFSGGS